jgi:hypothetical protein
MWLWIRVVFATLSVGLVLAVGCGGNVIVDGASGGGGGAGGDGGIPGAGTFPQSSSNSSVSTGTNTTSTGPTTTSTSTNVTSSVTTSSVSTGPGTCDGSGECGGFDSGCVGCAVLGPCEAQNDACTSSMECVGLFDCFNQCSDEQCYQDCVDENPDGAQLYNELVFCLICEACFDDCEGAAAGCP